MKKNIKAGDYLKKFKKKWINFWGSRYRVYKNNKKLGEIVIYKKKIYIDL